MATIIKSRATESDQLAQLNAVIGKASLGLVDEHSVLFSPPATFDEAIQYLDAIIAVLHTTLEICNNDLNHAASSIAVMQSVIDESEQVLEQLLLVEFDDALDHATTDFMDCVMASGKAGASWNGDLVFPEDTTISKAQLKPLLRETIQRWLGVKVSSL